MRKPKNSPPPPTAERCEFARRPRCTRKARGGSILSDRQGTEGRAQRRASGSTGDEEADRLTVLTNKRRELRTRAVEAMRDIGTRLRYLREQRAVDRAIERFWRRFFAKPRELERRPAPASRRRTGVTARQVPPSCRPIWPRSSTEWDGREYSWRALLWCQVGQGRASRAASCCTSLDQTHSNATATAIPRSWPMSVKMWQSRPPPSKIETLARSSRGNAKVVSRWSSICRTNVSPQARREILTRFCMEL